MPGTLTLRTGDLFSSDAPALGHGVNCFGVMGAGVAKLIAAKYSSAMLLDYRTACQTLALRPGSCRTWAKDAGMPLLANITSQIRTGPTATLALLHSGITKALADVEAAGMDRLAIPRIGCGIGGLRWAQVHPVLLDAVGRSSVSLEVWTLAA